MKIIEQNPIPIALPDFRNLGTILRLLLAANLGAMLLALADSPSFGEFALRFSEKAALVEPAVSLAAVLFYLFNDTLHRLSYAVGAAIVLAISLFCFTLFFSLLAGKLGTTHNVGLFRGWIYTTTLAGGLLHYFQLRTKALSPALAEARLQALQARIRPHFLFNSINAVLSLIRSQPRKAEGALEDLAELFRVVMGENNQLSSLERELNLARSYLAIEELRLGDRLQIDWHTDKAPGKARIPPLILQPLLENAVYHGIEPSTEPGVISVNIYRSRHELHIDIRNPYQPSNGNHHAGNKMAMGNIRERLALFFDAEAELKTTIGSNFYQTHIVLPYRE